MNKFDQADSSKLKIRNFNIHPTNKSYWVFFYSDIKMAKYFEELLKNNSIEFEHHSSEDLVKRELYGIHRKDMEKATELNNIAIGKFRRPFIGDPVFRYFLILLSISVIALAIYGYFKNPV